MAGDRAFDDYLPLGMGPAEVAAWLVGVSSWKLDSAEGVLFVGSPGKMVIVGQAPSKGADQIALGGRSGARLRKLLGCSDEAEFRARFDVLNILPKWPGKAGKGDRFPTATARAIARRLRFRSSRVLLLGKAADAFGVEEWFKWAAIDLLGGSVCAVPHPSGVNRWWNEPSNMAVAAQFFEQLKASPPLC